LSDVPRRVFSDVKQQTENIRRQSAPTDEAFFKQIVRVNIFQNFERVVYLDDGAACQFGSVQIRIVGGFGCERSKLRFGQLFAPRISQKPVNAARNVAQMKAADGTPFGFAVNSSSLKPGACFCKSTIACVNACTAGITSGA
jgi:hypothetical protein